MLIISSNYNDCLIIGVTASHRDGATVAHHSWQRLIGWLFSRQRESRVCASPTWAATLRITTSIISMIIIISSSSSMLNCLSITIISNCVISVILRGLSYLLRGFLAQ